MRIWMKSPRKENKKTEVENKRDERSKQVKQHLWYPERNLHFHIQSNYESDMKAEQRLFLDMQAPIWLPLCTLSGFTAGCAPGKQWCKTKHRKTEDPGHRGHTAELGRRHVQRGNRCPVVRAANKATSRPEKKDRGLQKGGPRKNKKGSNGKNQTKERSRWNYRLMCLEINVDMPLGTCRHFWEKRWWVQRNK